MLVEGTQARRSTHIGTVMLAEDVKAPVRDRVLPASVMHGLE